MAHVGSAEDVCFVSKQSSYFVSPRSSDQRDSLTFSLERAFGHRRGLLGRLMSTEVPDKAYLQLYVLHMHRQNSRFLTIARQYFQVIPDRTGPPSHRASLAIHVPLPPFPRGSHYGGHKRIDIALWDIAGKYIGVPSYQLLGGKCRDKARVYYHVKGETTEELVQGCIDAKNEGFTAVGHLTPFLDESRDEPHFETHAQMISHAVDRVRRYREAVGNEVDPLHRNPSASGSC